jgi:PhnB protein
MTPVVSGFSRTVIRPSAKASAERQNSRRGHHGGQIPGFRDAFCACFAGLRSSFHAATWAWYVLAAAMQLTTYLNFKGECEAAFTLYAQCLGARVGPMFRYGGTPLADQVPAGWSDKVMHGSLTIGDQVLMGADVAPERYDRPKGFSLSVQIDSIVEAERIFQALADHGTIVAPLEKTFWAERFGVLVDRFGVQWLINCEGSDQSAG